MLNSTPLKDLHAPLLLRKKYENQKFGASTCTHTLLSFQHPGSDACGSLHKTKQMRPDTGSSTHNRSSYWVATPDLKDAWRVLCDIINADDGVEDEEQGDDWCKTVTNCSCSKLLYEEQDCQYGYRNANNGACAMKLKSVSVMFHDDVRHAATCATPRRRVIATAASDVQT